MPKRCARPSPPPLRETFHGTRHQGGDAPRTSPVRAARKLRFQGKTGLHAHLSRPAPHIPLLLPSSPLYYPLLPLTPQERDEQDRVSSPDRPPKRYKGSVEFPPRPTVPRHRCLRTQFPCRDNPPHASHATARVCRTGRESVGSLLESAQPQARGRKTRAESQRPHVSRVCVRGTLGFDGVIRLSRSGGRRAAGCAVFN